MPSETGGSGVFCMCLKINALTQSTQIFQHVIRTFTVAMMNSCQNSLSAPGKYSRILFGPFDTTPCTGSIIYNKIYAPFSHFLIKIRWMWGYGIVVIFPSIRQATFESKREWNFTPTIVIIIKRRCRRQNCSLLFYGPHLYSTCWNKISTEYRLESSFRRIVLKMLLLKWSMENGKRENSRLTWSFVLGCWDAFELNRCNTHIRFYCHLQEMHLAEYIY